MGKRGGGEKLIKNFINSLSNPNHFQVLVSERVAILKSPFVFLFTVHSNVHYPCYTDVYSGQTRLMSLPMTVLGDLCANTVPGRVSDKSNAVLGSHVIFLVFILRGAGLLGGAGRCRCHLCLLGGLLHL